MDLFSAPLSAQDADNRTAEWLASNPGWVVVGSSAWTGPNWKEEQAVRQAESVRATLVIVQSRLLGSQSGYMPIAVPVTSTTVESGSFNTPSSYGTFSGTSTSFGTQTTLVPYERVTMSVTAHFLALRKSHEPVPTAEELLGRRSTDR